MGTGGSTAFRGDHRGSRHHRTAAGILGRTPCTNRSDCLRGPRSRLPTRCTRRRDRPAARSIPSRSGIASSARSRAAARLFLAVFLSVVAMVAIVTLLTPKRYTTETKMIAGNPGGIAANPQGAQTGLTALNALLIPNAAQSSETYAELISETPVVQHVIDDLGLKTNVGTLKGAIRVKPVTNTNIVSLQVTWSDPVTSAKIANDFANVFVTREAELVAGSGDRRDRRARQAVAGGRSEAARRGERRQQVRDDAQHRGHRLADDLDWSPPRATSTPRSTPCSSRSGRPTRRSRPLSAQIARMSPTTGGGSSVGAEPGSRAAARAARAAQGAARQRRGAVHRVAPDGDRSQAADRGRGASDQGHAVDDRLDRRTRSRTRSTSSSASSSRRRGRSATATAHSSRPSPRSARRSTRSSACCRRSPRRWLSLQRQKKLAEDMYNALQQKYNDASIARSTGISDVTITEPASAALATKTPRLGVNLAIAHDRRAAARAGRRVPGRLVRRAHPRRARRRRRARAARARVDPAAAVGRRRGGDPARTCATAALSRTSSSCSRCATARIVRCAA